MIPFPDCRWSLGDCSCPTGQAWASGIRLAPLGITDQDHDEMALMIELNCLCRAPSWDTTPPCERLKPFYHVVGARPDERLTIAGRTVNTGVSLLEGAFDADN